MSRILIRSSYGLSNSFLRMANLSLSCLVPCAAFDRNAVAVFAFQMEEVCWAKKCEELS